MKVTTASKGTMELMQTVLYHLMNLVTRINNVLFGKYLEMLGVLYNNTPESSFYQEAKI